MQEQTQNMSLVKELSDQNITFLKNSCFVFVLAWLSTMGTQVHVFKLVTWKSQICDDRFGIIEHSYLPCFHTHVLHIHQQRENPEFPDLFSLHVALGNTPRLRPGWCPVCFPKPFACMLDLFWGICSSTLCHVIVGLGPCLTPTFEELCEWYF